MRTRTAFHSFDMKRVMRVMMALVFISATSAGICGCSSDDNDILPPNGTEVNVLYIQSDNGSSSTAYMYKENETYNPPRCYLGKEIRYNGGNPITLYHMSFGANIKDSGVFDMLDIGFESDQPLSFSDLKEGDTFEVGQFQAHAYYTPTWFEKIMKGTTALSGRVTVVGKKKTGDKEYMVLHLSNLRFDAIDHSCVYSVNGTVEYEILNTSYE